MKVLLLANPGNMADEGARNVSRAILAGMKHKCDVLSFPAPAATKHLAEIRSFNPQIVHSIHGPSVRTFALMVLLHLVLPKAALLVSLSQAGPWPRKMRPVLKGLSFIRLLSQDPISERFFCQLGFSVQPLPNGVDIDQFRPTKPNLPQKLRAGLDPDRLILMHIGHLKPNRGLDILTQLNGYRSWQVLIVGSPTAPAVPEIVTMLQAAGCVVYREFIEDLPGLYSSINAYVFPVYNQMGAIDMPLSVLEAMACNLPVLSTRFKALPRFIPQGKGFWYFDSVNDAKNCLDQVMVSKDIATREKVAPFSWENILNQLEEIYKACLHA